jgi:hypothetical protein
MEAVRSSETSMYFTELYNISFQIIIIIIMALEPFDGPSPPFQVLDSVHSQ